nr:aminotransferase class V-fold PLP-dependent enzyme [Streptococcus agalactiae]
EVSRPDAAEIEQILQNDPAITHIAMVHSETTTGMLNPIEEVAELAKRYDKRYIVDAMSSFGGIPLDIAALNIDYLISSANKCIQ